MPKQLMLGEKPLPGITTRMFRRSRGRYVPLPPSPLLLSPLFPKYGLPEAGSRLCTVGPLPPELEGTYAGATIAMHNSSYSSKHRAIRAPHALFPEIWSSTEAGSDIRTVTILSRGWQQFMLLVQEGSPHTVGCRGHKIP